LRSNHRDLVVCWDDDTYDDANEARHAKREDALVIYGNGKSNGRNCAKTYVIIRR